MAEPTNRPAIGDHEYKTLYYILLDEAKTSAGLAAKAAALLYDAQCKIEDAAELFGEAHLQADKAAANINRVVEECRAYVRGEHGE